MAIITDHTGKRFGMLTVVSRAPNWIQKSGRTRPRWNCVCDCGGSRIAIASELVNGGTDNCGCQTSTRLSRAATKHGKSGSETYGIWAGMMKRCYTKSTTAYKNYGAKGIIVCDSWHKFEHFLRDMGERPSGLELDRINPIGNYEPSNCRWVTAKENCRNKTTNAYLTIDGVKKLIVDWANEVETPLPTMYWRNRQGWTPEEVLYGRG